jgi:hypothetical protein
VYAPFVGGDLLTDDFVHFQRLTSQTIADIVSRPDAFRFYRPVTDASPPSSWRCTAIDRHSSGRSTHYTPPLARMLPFLRAQYRDGRVVLMHESE